MLFGLDYLLYLSCSRLWFCFPSYFCRAEHINNSCFLCGIERHEFEKLCGPGTNGFQKHRETTHNLLFYLHFAVRIWSQPIEEDDGIENHVRKCMEVGDVGWCPIGISPQTIQEQTGDHLEGAIAKAKTVSHGGGHGGGGHGGSHGGGPTPSSVAVVPGNSSHDSHHGPEKTVAEEGADKPNTILMEKLDLLGAQMLRLVDEKLSSEDQFGKMDMINDDLAGGSSVLQPDTGSMSAAPSFLQQQPSGSSFKMAASVAQSVTELGDTLEKISRRLDKLHKRMDERDASRDKRKTRGITPESSRVDGGGSLVGMQGPSADLSQYMSPAKPSSASSKPDRKAVPSSISVTEVVRPPLSEQESPTVRNKARLAETMAAGALARPASAGAQPAPASTSIQRANSTNSYSGGGDSFRLPPSEHRPSMLRHDDPDLDDDSEEEEDDESDAFA